MNCWKFYMGFGVRQCGHGTLGRERNRNSFSEHCKSVAKF